jgi:uncharacterized protein (TIGR00369 family)
MIDIATLRQRLDENFAPWVLELGLTVDAISAESATLRIPANERLSRVGGILSGQALAAASDTAMVLAVACAAGEFKPINTVDLTINYMRPIIGTDAILAARVMRLGKTIAFCTTEISEAKSGKIAAFATGTFALPG